MSFPDDFVFEGGTVMGRVQTGQAVPPLLAKAIAEKALDVITPPESEFAIIHDNTPGTAFSFRDSHQRLEDAEILTFTQGLERWPHLREQAAPYDTPDIILVRRSDGEPYLILEETTDSCSSDKAFQRYARMRGAAENGLIGLHAQRLASRSVKRRGSRGLVPEIYYLNLRLPQAFRVLEELHPDSSVSYVVYPLNAGLTPTDRSDADQWQTDEGDQDTMWQRIGSVVGILVDGLDAGLSMAQINQNVRSSPTRAAFDTDLENWVAHVQRSRTEGGLGYTSYSSRYANHPTAFRTWTQAEALSAGIPAEIIGDSPHVHRYLLETDAYMRPHGGTPGDPYAGHTYGLRTLYVEGGELQHPFVLHLSGVTCAQWDKFVVNPEIKGVRMLRNSVEGILLSDGFRTIPTVSQS
jgi:hypothetical protein